MTNLDELRVLSLNNNLIHGELPRALGRLSNLEYLLLYKNNFHGTIPLSIVNCQKLITFIIYGNSFIGHLPLLLGRLQGSLRMLDVSYNELSGNLPSSIGDLINLEELYVNHNHLVGVIPDTISKMLNLKSFMYHENKITNTMINIGSADVYSEPGHDTLAEDYYQEWKNGIEFNKNKNVKIQHEEEKKRHDYQELVAKKKEGDAFALDAKAAAMLPPAFRPGGGGGGGGPPSLGTQVGGGPVIDGT